MREISSFGVDYRLAAYYIVQCSKKTKLGQPV